MIEREFVHFADGPQQTVTSLHAKIIEDVLYSAVDQHPAYRIGYDSLTNGYINCDLWHPRRCHTSNNELLFYSSLRTRSADHLNISAVGPHHEVLCCSLILHPRFQRRFLELKNSGAAVSH